MPSLSQYKQKLAPIKTCGNARKYESDLIEEYTFTEDLNYQIGYFYDYFIDDNREEYLNLDPTSNTNKTAIEVKFIAGSKNSEGKDVVGYYIEFKPSFRWEETESLSWYKERFVDSYAAQFPIGCYVDLPDEKGVYRKWLITEEGGWLNTQFPTWYVLPIDYCFRWCVDNKLYSMCGVSRGQSSYNSGQWSSRGGAVQTTEPENQKICVLPMNTLSSTISYDQRMVISQPIKIPIVWQCSKIENTESKGINRLTFAQTRWNEHTDAFWYGDDNFTPIFRENKKIYGIYANYFSSDITPDEAEIDVPTTMYGKITWNASPQIRVSGHYKKFNVTYYDNDEEIELPSGNWKIYSDDEDITDSMLISKIIDSNSIKIKFNGDDSWSRKILLIKYEAENGVTAEANVEIISK